jgi:hypothetical protein
MACASTRTAFQQLGIDLALAAIMNYGSQYYYERGDGTVCTIWALALPGKETKTFGPDEDRLTLIIPYQTGFTEAPDSGSKIITTDTAETEYAVDTSSADDGAFPVTWEVECFRWLHQSPEIDGS